ncbi:MAG: hypothetical protein AB7Q42_23180 [Acidimicrobiia bacterium]
MSEPVDVHRRRYVFPMHGDTIETVARRLFPGDDEATRRLLSWNLHLALRRAPVGAPGQLLGTDIVYVEPPLP